MATNVTVAGITYSVPSYNDTGWGQGTGSVDKLLIALANNISSNSSIIQIVSATITPITVVSGKTYLVASNSLAVTLNLPAPVINTYLIVKDSGGNSETNAITIHPNGSESIDGTAGDLVLKANYGIWMFISDGSNWFTIITT